MQRVADGEVVMLRRRRLLDLLMPLACRFCNFRLLYLGGTVLLSVTLHAQIAVPKVRLANMA